MPGRTINGLAAESSRKRGRRDDAQSQEDEVVEVQQARSNLRTEPVSCQPDNEYRRLYAMVLIIILAKTCTALRCR